MVDVNWKIATGDYTTHEDCPRLVTLN